MIKVKQYPPVISLKTVIEDNLLNAKSHATVVKRLEKLKVSILAFEMVDTLELFKALRPKQEVQPEIPTKASTKPFKLRR